MFRVVAVFHYWLIRQNRTWRSTALISIANPLLFLVGIGLGVGHLIDSHHPSRLGGVSYVDFFAPGLLAISAMQIGFYEGGLGVAVAAGRGGSYPAAASTPLEPEEILTGHLLFIALRIVMSSTLILLAMAVLGLCHGWRVVGLFPAALLTGLAFGVPAAAWAVGLRSVVRLNGLYRFVLMPMYMFSGAFFALDELPGGVRLIAEASPLAQGVALCRSLTLGGTTTPDAIERGGYLSLIIIVGVYAARCAYRRQLHP